MTRVQMLANIHLLVTERVAPARIPYNPNDPPRIVKQFQRERAQELLSLLITDVDTIMPLFDMLFDIE